MATTISFFIGLVSGGTVGFIAAALLAGGGRDGRA